MASTEQRHPSKGRPGFAAGSEGWDGTEDPVRPITSSNPGPDVQDDPDNAAAPRGNATEANANDSGKPTQSDYALSNAADDVEGDDDGRYRVSEELNFDQQSDAARRVGHAPKDTAATQPTEAMGETMERGDSEDKQSRSEDQDEAALKDKAALKKSMARSVPPSR